VARSVSRETVCGIAAVVLLVACPWAAPGAPLQGAHAGGARAGLPLPHALPLQDYERVLYKFLFTRAYTTAPYSWTRDKDIRDTGPFIAGDYHGTHPAVRIYYSPEAMNWLSGGRKGEIADGGMIIKEMFYPPAALYYEPTFGVPELQVPKTRASLLDILMFAWTVMVKDSSVAKGGWFYSDVNAPVPKIVKKDPPSGQFEKAIEAAVEEVLDSYKLKADPSESSFPGSGTALGTCQRCHASAAREMTFSSLRNIQGQPLRFRIDESWRDARFLTVLKEELPNLFVTAALAGGGAATQGPALRGIGGGLVARPEIDISQDPREYFISAGHRPPRRDMQLGGMGRGMAAQASAPNPEFVTTFPFASPTSNPKEFPSQWADHVVAGPKGAEAFITSDNCLGCHGGLGGGASGLTTFVPTGKKYGQGYNLSEYGDWRWSPMGLAGRDPIFHSQVESELALLDAEFPPTQAASAKNALINLKDNRLLARGWLSGGNLKTSSRIVKLVFYTTIVSP
jgi:mono/diheme cytochrome c family protein/cytochrome c553